MTTARIATAKPTCSSIPRSFPMFLRTKSATDIIQDSARLTICKLHDLRHLKRQLSRRQRLLCPACPPYNRELQGRHQVPRQLLPSQRFRWMSADGTEKLAHEGWLRGPDCIIDVCAADS